MTTERADPTTAEAACPFCTVPLVREIAGDSQAFAVRDMFPVSAGHSLVIPRRHIPDWWSATDEERTAILALVDVLKDEIDAEYSPVGYNVGFNDGAGAGQTVFHLHVHVIPRYEGDVPDPRGGIRHVIPGRGNYLADTADPPAAVTRLHDGPLRPLAPALADAIEREDIAHADLVVSFVMQSGLRILQPRLDDIMDRGGRVRLLTTDYLGVTEKAALQQLLPRGLEHGDRFQVRVFRADGTSFHPKSYLLGTRDQYRVGFTGSANISGPGLRDGVEWSVETRNPAGLQAMRDAFEALWTDPRSIPLTQALVDTYEEAPRPAGADAVAVAAPTQPFTPTPVQREALAALEATRADGFRAGMVVLATGLGKTWLAAFDSTRPQFQRVLFVAHREEILAQARDVFRRIRPDASVGFVMADQDDADADIVMATIQTLSRRLDRIEPDAFDYVVIDEFHHAAAASYRRVVNHLSPRFLLGLTATPDRSDGADLMSLCEDNLVYECGLSQGITRELLSPFHYYGVPDPVDFAPLPWRNARFDPEALEAAVITEERAEAAWREWASRRGARTLAFCVSQRHADWMAEVFRAHGVNAVAVHSGPISAPRHESLSQLGTGELDVIFSVDMFNEGVNVPAIDTALLLRPTTSPVLFLQQIGRGLRLHPGKSHLTVIDFIGNHRSFLLPARLLQGLSTERLASTSDLHKALQTRAFALPPGCLVDYQVEARDNLLDLIPRVRGQALGLFIDEWQAEHGSRPTATQAYRGNANPNSAVDQWFGFLLDRGSLTAEEASVAVAHLPLLTDIAKTSMNKSYKMVALRAFADAHHLTIGIPVHELAELSRRLVLRDPRLVTDVTNKEIADPAAVSEQRWESWWRKWPLTHLTGRGEFRLTDDQFRLRVPPTDANAPILADLINELVDWRLARYLDTKQPERPHRSVVKVLRNSSDSPILMLLRERNPQLPSGRSIPVQVGDETVLMDFMKVAVNVARRDQDSGNVLGELLVSWFGPTAGEAGTRHEVEIWRTPTGLHAAPRSRSASATASAGTE